MRPGSSQHVAPNTADEFEIALICALPLEADAVNALFDQSWDDEGFPYTRDPSDTNTYTVGRIGRHNIVLAHMPGMGKASAATVAARCSATFRGIKLALVVGVCGVVPFVPANKATTEIVLGDVVISDALVQYDFGRKLPEAFVRKSTLEDSLGRPNAQIRGVLAKLQGKQARKRLEAKTAEYLTLLRDDPDLEAQYPGTSHDRLFEASYRHTLDGTSCDECGCDGSLVPRERLKDPSSTPWPAVHLGRLASGDTVLKSGKDRDSIAQQERVIGFEMEGAGVWDSFPCVVIKAGCDYADSHKTKVWQRYAAASAAACTKAFLEHWMPSVSSRDHRATNSIPNRNDLTPDDGREKTLAEVKGEFLHDLGASSPKYKMQKDRNPDRVPGTCEWFHSHEKFQHWMEQISALLWVSADPGCGKSVLVKHLVDEVLPSTDNNTTCYFFFKDDFEDQREVVHGLRSLLSQLFQQQPALLSADIVENYRQRKQDVVNTFTGLWNMLIQVARRNDTGSITCILDAIDECQEKGRVQLLEALNELYSTDPDMALKFLITSRPYLSIRRKFRPLEASQPTIHLSGESEAEVESISREVSLVIQARIDGLEKELALSPETKQLLEGEISKTKHRTYLWVFLVFDDLHHYFEDNLSILTHDALVAHIRTLPKTVEAFYDKMLSKVRQVEQCKRILHLVVAAYTALSLDEMAAALTVEVNHSVNCRGILESSDQILQKIRESCGLLVVISDSRVYLLHQSAREFLVQGLAPAPLRALGTELKWHGCLDPVESHRVLAEVCVWRLILEDCEDVNARFIQSRERGRDSLLFYAAKHWANHFHQACKTNNETTVHLAVRLVDPEERIYRAWTGAYSKAWSKSLPHYRNSLILASWLGLDQVIKLLPQQKTSHFVLKRHYEYFGLRRCALSWASENGHDSVVKLLLDRVTRGGSMLLTWPPLKLYTLLAQRMPTPKVYCLNWSCGNGTVVNVRDASGLTPLFYAVINGHTSIVEHLIEKGANINIKDKNGLSPLDWAEHNNHHEIVQLLQKRGAKHGFDRRMLERKVWAGATPLLQAVERRNEATVRILLEKGADIEARDHLYRTPLLIASRKGPTTLVKMLLEGGAEINAQNSRQETPLLLAAKTGYPETIELLLERDASINTRNNQGQTPLIIAASRMEHTDYILVTQYKDGLHAGDNETDDSFQPSVFRGHENTVRMLIKHGAYIEARDDEGSTALAVAAGLRDPRMVQLLLDKGADIEARDVGGRTPLGKAAASCNWGWPQFDGYSLKTVQVLIEAGAEINAKDERGRTPLDLAAGKGTDDVVWYLKDRGAEGTK